MKMNPKIAQSPEDLKGLEFKKMKAFIKKDLARLEKNTSVDKPTSVLISADFAYQDKPAGIGFILFGAWKGAFKNYAKNDIAKNDALGAIGQAYYGGIDADGQKIIRIDLAKGKAKGKSDKLARGLKKLVPQSVFNLVFGEMTEDALQGLEQKLDTLPEPEILEVFEELTEEEIEGELEVQSNQSYQLLLDSNLKELSDAIKTIIGEVHPRLKAKMPQESDADFISNTLDLATEWCELYEESPEDTQELTKNVDGLKKVQNIITQLIPMLPLLGKLGVNPTATGTIPNGGLPSILKEGEKPAPGLDTGLSAESIQKMFLPQGLSNNCNAAAKYMVYSYLQERGLISIDNSDILATSGKFKGRLVVKDGAMEKKISGKPEFRLGSVLGQKVLQEDKNSGGYIPDANYKKTLAYIDTCLAKGLPVVAGVSHTHTNDSGYNEGTTDHFIVIVGKNGNCFCYIDPANTKGGDINKNVLEPSPQADYMFVDKHSPMGMVYVITTVAQFKGDDANANAKKDAPLGNTITMTLQKGMNNTEVKILQTALNKLPYNYKLKVDGDFGNKSHNAVMDVQTKNNLTTNGIVEPNSATWAAISGKPIDNGANATALKPEQIQFQYKGGAAAITPKAEAVLRDILAKANEPTASIVATFRSNDQQASVMYLNLERIGAKANRKMYKDKGAAAKVIDAYEKAKNEGKTQAQIVGAMLAVGGFDKISEHCNAGNPAIDIHPSSIKNKTTFEAIIKADGRVSVICPPQDTTYHIKVK